MRHLPAAAQLVLLEEDFDAGFPSSWSNVLQGSNADIWETGLNKVNGSPDMLHEWFCDFSVFFRDNILLSPAIDLSVVSSATLTCDQFHFKAAVKNERSASRSYNCCHERASRNCQGSSSIQRESVSRSSKYLARRRWALR